MTVKIYTSTLQDQVNIGFSEDGQKVSKELDIVIVVSAGNVTQPAIPDLTKRNDLIRNELMTKQRQEWRLRLSGYGRVDDTTLFTDRNHVTLFKEIWN